VDQEADQEVVRLAMDQVQEVIRPAMDQPRAQAQAQEQEQVMDLVLDQEVAHTPAAAMEDLMAVEAPPTAQEV